jgi:hypothetical protein
MAKSRYSTPARTNGGFLIHAVDPETMYAACGHKPKGSSSHRMRNRARWLKVDKKTPISGEKCLKAMKKRKEAGLDG